MTQPLGLRFIFSRSPPGGSAAYGVDGLVDTNNIMRVALADSRPLLREGLESFINSCGYKVAASPNLNHLKQLLDTQTPEVLVLGAISEAISQTELAGLFARQFPEMRIVILAAESFSDQRRRRLAAEGILALPPHVSFEGLKQTLDDLAHDETDLAGRGAGTRQDVTTDNSRVLTERETQILRMLAEGLQMKQIATELHLSTKTIETHRRNLSNKLGVSSIPKLTRQAVRMGLTDLSYATN